MTLSILNQIGLDPDALFDFVAQQRAINFDLETRLGLSTSLSETAFIAHWAQQNGLSSAFSQNAVAQVAFHLVTDGGGGILIDIVQSDLSFQINAEAYQIYRDHALASSNDIVGQLAGTIGQPGFEAAIEELISNTQETYPNWTEDQVNAFVRVVILDQAVLTQFGHMNLLDSINQRTEELFGAECFGPDTAIDMWPLDREFAPDPSNPNKIFDQDAVRAKIWKKPIAMICKGDVVVSFDKNDNLMPGRVTRTFENESKILLDYFGTRVTPGHVYFRPDSKKTDKFECLLDILRDDGMIQNVEGKNIRAATNVPVGDPRDGFVWAITKERKDGILVEKERGRIRLGTRFIVDGKTSQCVADVIEAKGGIVGDDELIRFVGAAPVPFVWEHGGTLPKPEDFVLQASGTTLADIYKADEWENRRPQMTVPLVMDGGPVQPLSATALSAMPRNQPLNLQPAATSAAAPKRTARPQMNRKQRKAMEAKQRRAAKMRNRAAS